MTTNTLIAFAVFYGLGVFTGLSAPKIKSWFSAAEAKATVAAKTEAASVAADIQKKL
jgi:hypothetical protein